MKNRPTQPPCPARTQTSLSKLWTTLFAAGLLLFLASPARALNAVWNSAADIPVTAAGYTAASTVTFSLNFAPTPGTTLTVVNNTALPFISGTFSNLAQGQPVALTFGGTTYNFVANYYGGTGNDLVLQWAATRTFAWGGNYSGQLGNNRTEDSPVPVAVNASGVLAGKTVIAGTAGGSSSYLLLSDGTIAAWGRNVYGQLGNKSTTGSRVPVLVNTVAGVSALAGKKVISLSAGGGFCLALCSDGTVASWGDNDGGALGTGDEALYKSLVPVPVSTAAGASALSGKTVVAISAGYQHALALCSDGTLAAWGAGGDGQLGNNGSASSAVPVAVNTDSGVSALSGKSVVGIAAGWTHSSAACSDGTAAAWGSNSKGQLGFDNLAASRPVPVAVLGSGVLEGQSVVKVAGGYQHAAALTATGVIATWGYNQYGQLGDPLIPDQSQSPDYSTKPVLVDTTGFLSGKVITLTGAGRDHSFALTSDGQLAAWGFSTLLGNNSTTRSKIPVAVSTAGLTQGERFVNAFSGAIAGHMLAVAGINSSPGAGSLTVTLSPAAAVAAGASFSVDGGAWQASGTTVSGLTAGSHMISFNDLPGYFTPPERPVMVLAGQTATSSITVLADAPFMVVEQPAGSPLASGTGSVDYGLVPLDNPVEKSFTVKNTGTRNLTGVGVTKSGVGGPEWAITTYPSVTVAPGASTTFTVAFTPASAGTRMETLSITNIDDTQNPFLVALTGTGDPAPNPFSSWIWRNPTPQGNNLNCMTHAAGLFVAVGDNATILTSPDGVIWTARSSPRYADLWDVAYGNGIFMAVGSNDTVLTSPDGVSWTDHTLPAAIFVNSFVNFHGIAFGGGKFAIVGGDGLTPVDTIISTADGVTYGGGGVNNPNGYWWRIAYGNGKFVASGDGGATATSSNGTFFTTQGTGTIVNLNGIAFGNGTFTAVGTYSIAGENAYSATSTDGIHWTPHNIPRVDFVEGLVTGMSFVNGKFLAKASYYDEVPNAKFLSSVDGVNWTVLSNTGAALGRVSGIAYGAGTYVGVGGYGSILTSPDTLTWTAREALVTDYELSGVAGNGSTLVTVGAGGTILSSSNGSAWVPRVSGTTVLLNGVLYAGGSFVAVGDSGTILTSPDAVTWSPRTSGTAENLISIGYGNGLFIAGTGGGAVLTSGNLATWMRHVTVGGTSQGSFRSIAYGNGLYVGVGSPSGKRIIQTSPDGTTWTQRLPSSTGSLASVVFTNGLFVIVGDKDILTSTDGLNWTSQTAPAFGILNTLTFSNGMFVAAGAPLYSTATGHLVKPSTVLTSPDGFAWTRRTSPTTNPLYGITGMNGTFVAVGWGGTILTTVNGPDLSMDQPAGFTLTDGGSTVDFGHSLVGVGTSRVFTVRNTGNATLSALAISRDGANAGDFTLGAPGATTLAAGASTTFTVTFSPAAAGSRSATLHVAGNVTGPAIPFDVNLNGTGGTAQTESEKWRLQWFGTSSNTGPAHDSATPRGDGVPNLLKFATAMDPSQAGRMPGVAVRNGNNLEFTYTRSKAAQSDGITFRVEWSASLSTGSWVTTGVTETITSQDATTQQVKAIIPQAGGKRLVHLRVTRP